MSGRWGRGEKVSGPNRSKACIDFAADLADKGDCSSSLSPSLSIENNGRTIDARTRNDSDCAALISGAAGTNRAELVQDHDRAGLAYRVCRAFKLLRAVPENDVAGRSDLQISIQPVIAIGR